jgi:hypothetical protein
MEFSLRAILDKSGLHSNYMFASNFARPFCRMNGSEIVVKPSATSRKFEDGNITLSKPYLYSPVREEKIFKQPRRSKFILDPISTSFCSIHYSKIMDKGSIFDDPQFETRDLVVQGEILWKQRHPLEKRSFYQYLLDYEGNIQKTSKDVDLNLSIVRHVRWKGGCGRGRHVIDFTWINLALEDELGNDYKI